jgi:hypothetical protein
MLIEMNINLLGRGSHLSYDLAQILKTIDESGSLNEMRGMTRTSSPS